MERTNDLSDGFFLDLRTVCTELGCSTIDLLSVMQSESGVSASAANPAGAYGLTQITDLRGVGWANGAAAFLALSAQGQLPYVKKYFSPHVADGLNSAARIYQINFLPATLSRGSGMDVELCNNQGDLTAAYKANRGAFDIDNKGSITVGDLQDAVVRNRHGVRWTEILARLDRRPVDSIIDLRSAEGLQSALETLRFDPGTIDGLIGRNTRTALTNFQTSQGLPANGKPFPETIAALDSALTRAQIDHRT
jgi:hypothetical protein